MFRKTILTIMGVSLVQMLSAQMGYRHQVVPSLAPDSVDLAYYGKKRFGQSAALAMGVNFGVWAFNRYVLKEDFAYIGMHTIKENIKKGFVWDNDNLDTNTLFHPYHGNLYFNAARSNGYNFWQSGLFALGGSALWEFCMEAEYPSANDIVATPIGGMALGEIFYRTSDLILDDRTTGRERVYREMASFMVSPMRGVTRILNGDIWKHRSTSGRQFGIPDVCIALSVGARALDVDDERGMGITSKLDFEYGDRFNAEHERPYDFFSMGVGLNLQKSQPVLGQVNLVGRLLNHGVVEKSDMILNLGLYQYLDFYDSNAISDEASSIPYKIAVPASVGGGLQFQWQKVGDWDFSASLHGSGILMGAVLSDHYRLDNRDYNIASGFGTKARMTGLYKKSKFSVSLSHEFYRFFTWKGYDRNIDWSSVNPKTLNVQGDESQSSVHVCEFRLDYRLMRRMYLTGSFMYFHRYTHYRYYPDVRSSATSTRLMLTWIL